MKNFESKNDTYKRMVIDTSKLIVCFSDLSLHFGFCFDEASKQELIHLAGYLSVVRDSGVSILKLIREYYEQNLRRKVFLNFN